MWIKHTKGFLKSSEVTNIWICVNSTSENETAEVLITDRFNLDWVYRILKRTGKLQASDMLSLTDDVESLVEQVKESEYGGNQNPNMEKSTT